MSQVLNKAMKNITHIIRCGEYSVGQVVEGEVGRWIDLDEGHLGSSFPLSLSELLSDSLQQLVFPDV